MGGKKKAESEGGGAAIVATAKIASYVYDGGVSLKFTKLRVSREDCPALEKLIDDKACVRLTIEPMQEALPLGGDAAPVAKEPV